MVRTLRSYLDAIICHYRTLLLFTGTFSNARPAAFHALRYQRTSRKLCAITFHDHTLQFSCHAQWLGRTKAGRKVGLSLLCRCVSVTCGFRSKRPAKELYTVRASFLLHLVFPFQNEAGPHLNHANPTGSASSALGRGR